jgi:nucleotide-binding universal stress UspA family protein
MYKKILVPLDGSKRAEAILPYVEELAQCAKAKVIFLQVIEPVYVPIGTYSRKRSETRRLDMSQDHRTAANQFWSVMPLGSQSNG